jgi:DNA-directed RNA polymerase subunit RPC12/RpoP
VEETDEIIRCPKCGSKDTRVSFSRKPLDGFLRLFHRIPIRCRQCQNRFYIHGEPPFEDEPQENDNGHSELE